MKVRRVATLDGFEALAPLWAGVARESGQTSPFLSHDWFTCCWQIRNPSRRPEALVVEDTAGPVGLVPLVRQRGWLRGLPVRILGMLNSPDTPLVEWLMLGRPEPVVEAVMSYLAGRGDWDVFALDALPTESLTLKGLEGWLPGRFRWERRGVVHAPYLLVTGSWDEFWTAKSQRFKKTVRSVRNRLSKAGLVTVAEHRTLGGDSPVFQEVLDVSRRSWKAKRGVAIATMPGMPAFFRELTERASAKGWLRLWVLRLEGRAVATEYQLEANGRVHALRADFDSSLPDELSPGTYLNCEILRALFAREGVHEYNMGPGDNAYKTRWASDAHETVRLRIFRPGLYGALLHGLETRAVPALKRLRGGGARA
jgi:CelD/BcsL family acetyltransferase involved in cellulose biosynthesis